MEPNFQTQNIIKAENLHKTYLFGLEGVAALRGVSLDIKEGQFIIILGNSGGGKTSLLNILGTIDRQTKGNYTLYGQKIKANTADDILSGLRLNYLGFVFQTFNLISSLTAQQNVQLPMILKGELSGSAISQRAKQLLQSVGMSHRLKHYPNQLSGGQQQRVTIARALANEPKVLLLDEPTGDLDSKNGKIVLDILIKLNKKNKITLIMVTHDVNLKFYSNRVLKVLDGKIIGEEIIDAQIRQQSIKDLHKNVEEIKNLIAEQKQNEISPQFIENSEQPSQVMGSLQRRGVQQYGAVKWLRQKAIRQKLQQQIAKKFNSYMNQQKRQQPKESII